MCAIYTCFACRRHPNPPHLPSQPQPVVLLLLPLVSLVAGTWGRPGSYLSAPLYSLRRNSPAAEKGELCVCCLKISDLGQQTPEELLKNGFDDHHLMSLRSNAWLCDLLVSTAVLDWATERCILRLSLGG